MKVKLSIIMVFVMLIGSFTVSQAVTQVGLFGTPTSWAKEEIDQLTSYELLKQDAFRDYQSQITRQQFIYLAVRLYEAINGEEIMIDKSISFTDTNDVYALKGATVGITTGIGEGKFGPNIKLNREQLATLVVRALELSGFSLEKSTMIFTDEPSISAFAKDAVYKANFYGIVLGSNNAFMPSNGATIEQSLVIFKRAYDQFGDSEEKTRLSASEIANKIGPAMVYIETFDEAGLLLSNGSGFIVEESGKIVTNFHVIEGAFTATVKLKDGKSYPVLHVLGYDYIRDIAILKIAGSNLKTVNLGNSERIVQGEALLSMGHQVGVENAISEELIKSKSVKIEAQKYIQLTSPMSIENSGGVLLNYYGDVIGVMSAIDVSKQNLNLAIPINEVKPYLRSTTSKTLAQISTTVYTGTVTFDNGDLYKGQLKIGYMHGKGTYTWENGDYYTGSFYEGYFHGVGTIHYSDGTIIKGEWLYDKFFDNLMIPKVYADATSSTSLDIGWDSIDNAQYYYVYYAYDINGPWYYFTEEDGSAQQVAHVGKYSATINDNQPGATVYIAVSSVIFDVESEHSPIINVTLPK